MFDQILNEERANAQTVLDYQKTRRDRSNRSNSSWTRAQQITKTDARLTKIQNRIVELQHKCRCRLFCQGFNLYFIV